MSLTIPPARIVEESDSPLLAAADGWLRRPLAEVSTVLNGFAFKSNQFSLDAGMPLIRIRDLFKDRTSVGYVGEYDGRYLVHPGDLLVGMDGDFNCSRWRGSTALLNQRVCKITIDPDRLDLDFLTYLLPGYLQAIHDRTSSTTVTHLSSRDVAQIPIPVPPVAEQRRVVQRLNQIGGHRDATTTHLARARTILTNFRKAVLAAACSGRLTESWRDERPDLPAIDLNTLELNRPRRRSRQAVQTNVSLPDIPSSYVLTTIGNIAEVLDYGTSRKADGFYGDVPVLRMGNIQDGMLDLSNLKFMTNDAEVERLMLRSGDLLFNRTNSPELVGKSAVWQGSEPTTFASYLIRVRFHGCAAIPEFVNYWINSSWGRLWARQEKTDGVSQSNINGTKLGTMPIPLPPIDEQREIVRRVERALQASKNVLTQVDTASNLLDRTGQAALAKAFRGELQTPEAGASA